MEISNLLNKELKVMTVKMFKDLRRRLDEQSEELEVFNKELENVKNHQTGMKKTVSEINRLEGISSRLDDRKTK